MVMKFFLLSVILFIGLKTANSDKIGTKNEYQLNIETIEYKESIKKIKLKLNQVGSLHEDMFKGFSSLTHLTIINSGIQDIEKNAFSHLQTLEYLDLSNNQISKLSDYMFEGLPNLKKLILNCNLIKIIDSLEFSNLTNLIELEIKNNELRSIFENSFKGLTNVEIIDLSGNSIEYIQERSFDSCQSLQHLFLENTENLVIKSLWSAPTNFELFIIDSGKPVQTLVDSVNYNLNVLAEQTRNLEANYYNQYSSSMSMIITIIIISVIFILVVVGILIYFKRINNKNKKSEVATVDNGMCVVYSQ